MTRVQGSRGALEGLAGGAWDQMAFQAAQVYAKTRSEVDLPCKVQIIMYNSFTLEFVSRS